MPIMRAIILPFFMIFLLFAQIATAAETRYLASLPDIPLMPQMSELKDSRVIFDKAEGRIVQESAKAPNLTVQQVENFYNEALPALGWIRLTPQNQASNGPLNSTRFSRNGEQLVVNLEKLASEGLVLFAVSPSQR